MTHFDKVRGLVDGRYKAERGMNLRLQVRRGVRIKRGGVGWGAPR